MKKFFFACLLSVAAVPVSANQGCIEVSSTTVTATVCTQFDCVQQQDDNCVMWACSKTQTSKYVDAAASGCSRIANCGKKSLFVPGAPAADADTDSSEECDWYPCVQADPATQACLSYLCVSKRVFQIIRTTYPDAQCVPIPAEFLPPEKKPEPRPQTKTKPAAVKAKLQLR